MTASTPKTAFRAGVLDGLPFLLVMVPFGLLFGVMATEAGLHIVEAMSFSVIVIAGAAQFTALQLMGEGAPTLIVILTSLAVNLRMAMYSASLAPALGAAPLWQRALVAYVLVDATYACAASRFARETGWGLRERLAYFGGNALPVVVMWYAATLAGALIGAGLPGWLALDFAVPLCFLAMIGPMLRTVPHVLAAFTSVAAALVLAFMPYSTGLLVAAIAAMIVGAEAERRLDRVQSKPA